LLLFPVRSARGVFAYATCPYILNRLSEDFSFAGISVPRFEDKGLAQVSGKALTILNKNKIVLEEFTFDSEKTDCAEKIADVMAKWLKLEGYQAKLVKENLVILSDDDFKDFAQNNTEVITRTKIDSQTGTVAKGALFTEEMLPAETVLYSLMMTSRIFLPNKPKDQGKDKAGLSYRENSQTVQNAKGDEAKYLIETIAKNMPEYIQIGGDATIGKGLCRVTVGVEGEATK
jgi:CRISPR-associated protein Cmr4